MAAKNRFIIKRKDKDDAVDDVLLESEGLTIGRLVSNDLVLNHRMVSRTHAGIKEIGKEFWIFNLSSSNGTNLNGELVEQTPLADGDVVQIGPFLIRVNYAQTALSLTVERELQIAGEDYGAGQSMGASGGGEDASATIIMKPAPPPGTRTLTPGGTRRVEGTGVLRAEMPAEEEKTLDLFWEKRKREAGKIAERTMLHPRTGGRLGKFQFNWKPTADLARLWRKSYFYVGTAAVVLIAVAAVFAYESTYSPGPVSEAHVASFTKEALAKRDFAKLENANSCSSCHGVTKAMQNKCDDCHTTSTFKATIYDAHVREDVLCSSCHTEHQGKDVRAGLLSYDLCSRCHNGSYKIKTGENLGKMLPLPHGGNFGYPIFTGEGKWKLTPEQIKQKRLPDSWAKFEPLDQFHALHQMGRMANRMSCGDCHTRGAVHDGKEWSTSPREECGKCHGSFDTATGVQATQVNCNSCHRQHGQSTDLTKILDAAANTSEKLEDYIKGLATGGPSGGQTRKVTAHVNLFGGTGTADVLRQNKAAINWGLITNIGAVPWYYWAALVGLLPITALVVMAVGTARRKSSLESATAQPKVEQEVKVAETQNIEATTADIKKYYATIEQWKQECPPYPHPYVYTEFCIGCHACVDACPHDVLAIVSGHSSPIALDQCMEDTGCTVECPTSPKACILINGTKPIQKRKVPARNQSLMTNVEGVYMVGDVSGTPLIKNAINEGAQVLDFIQEDLKKEGLAPGAEYDVAVVGVGPAGLSAAVIAKQRGLTYVALEQDEIVATIAAYPKNKYVFFKPDTVDTVKGTIPLPGVGDKKEAMIEGWFKAMTDNGVVVNGEESCKSIKREGNIFHVATEKGKEKTPKLYKVRRVILAIGNRGTPQKLRVKGEEMNITVPEEQVMARHCPKCGGTREGKQQFCVKCGTPFPVRTLPAHEDTKVKYKLSDPDDYRGKHCIVVGAGNSAIEAAVDLSGFNRDGDKITFTRDNIVTLVVRSDLKGDLKLGNKMNLYDCIDAGKIKMLVRRSIKTIEADKVALMDARSEEVKDTLQNDFIFALIGGEKPTKFLEGIGIKIG